MLSYDAGILLTFIHTICVIEVQHMCILDYILGGGGYLILQILALDLLYAYAYMGYLK